MYNYTTCVGTVFLSNTKYTMASGLCGLWKLFFAKITILSSIQSHKQIIPFVLPVFLFISLIFAFVIVLVYSHCRNKKDRVIELR